MEKHGLSRVVSETNANEAKHSNLPRYMSFTYKVSKKCIICSDLRWFLLSIGARLRKINVQ